MAPLKLTGRHDDVDLERDRALVERCQAGDERAFEDLYLRYRDRLFRFCLRRTSNASEAEDLVQETFARAWKALPNFSGERRFYPWLSVIANNLCTDLARKGRRCTPVEESSLDLLSPAVSSEQEELVERGGEDAILAAALDRLSARHREVLELREGRNWSYQQIASHAGVEVSTIETLLFRARRSLKREYMTLAKTEAGLAGVLGLPLLGLRKVLAGSHRLLGRAALAARRLFKPAALPAQAGAAASPITLGSVVGGVVIVATAAVATFGGLVASRSHTSPAPAHHGSTIGHGSTAATGAVQPAARRRLVSERAPATARGAAAKSRARAGADATTAASSSSAVAPSAPSSASGVQQALGSGLKSVGSSVKKVEKSAAGALQGVSGTVSGVTSGVSPTASGVSGTVSGTVSGVSGTVSSVSGTVSGTVSGAAGGVGTVTSTTLPGGSLP